MSSLRSRENAVERVRGALREPQPGDFRSRSSAPPSLFAGQCIFGAGQRCPKSPGRSLAATIEAAAPQWRYVNPNDPSELVGVRRRVISPTLTSALELAGHRPT